MDSIKYATLRGLFGSAIPSYSGSFTRPDNICEDAEILRDANGVPSCFASEVRSLFFLNGVCQGQDRLWQLHSMRMAAAGRLSEIAGDKTVALDTMVRQLGLRALAEDDWKSCQARAESGDKGAADAVVMMEGFCQGINWAVSQARQLPAEFWLTGQRPWRAWQPEDALSIMRLQSFAMCFGSSHQLVRQALNDYFGADVASEWTGTALDEKRFPPTAPGDARVSEALRKASRASVAAALDRDREKGQGSNWWTVSGKHTSSGMPILASDPHLTVKVPHFWYEIGLTLRGGEAEEGKGGFIGAGVAAAGVPGIFIGHNSFAAWGITLGYADVEDLFVTRVRRNPSREGQYQYQYDGVWRDATTTVEHIVVKKSSPCVVQIIRTHRGVILREASSLQRYSAMAQAVCAAQTGQGDAKKGGSGDAGDIKVYLEYVGIQLRPRNRGLESLQPMLRARSFEEFDGALAALSTNVSLNFGYADTKGHIGYVLTGQCPVRKGERGAELLPICGWTSKCDYDGYLTHSQMPKSLDPEQGFIVSANHCMVDYKKGYPHYLGQVFKSGFRAAQIRKRILELLGSGQRGEEKTSQGGKLSGKIRPEDMMRLQNNTCSIAACDFIRLVSALELSGGHKLDGKAVVETQRQAIEWGMARLSDLLQTGGDMRSDSVPAAVYQVTHSVLTQNLIRAGFRRAAREKKDAGADPGFDENLLVAVLGGDAFDQAKVLKLVNEFQGNVHLNVLRMLRNASKSWWVSSAGGLENAFFSALLEAVALVRGDGSRAPMTWGEIHVMQFKHPLSAALGFSEGRGFDVPSLPGMGDTNTVRQVKCTSISDLGAVSSNISLRFIADMSDLRNGCRIITPLGNCGVLGSPYYAIDNKKWYSEQYRKMLWVEEDVRKAAIHRMTFDAPEQSNSCSIQ